MTNINFKLRNGELKKIDAEDGLTLMEVARDNDLGIEGTCGGSTVSYTHLTLPTNACV